MERRGEGETIVWTRPTTIGLTTIPNIPRCFEETSPVWEKELVSIREKYRILIEELTEKNGIFYPFDLHDEREGKKFEIVGRTREDNVS